ncbi:hypothetical protein D9758_015458 [Tetrapyrgos nigripes]|uniref:Uncharacterized protein n=1 Tax=Tetrapyrgos nigripes TaxID=182062 RepID=A0A8H5CP25_9AGAR|nr:hypothetical protein D9758_015458 [Tetrapyrgos nigripes]
MSTSSSNRDSTQRPTTQLRGTLTADGRITPYYGLGFLIDKYELIDVFDPDGSCGSWFSSVEEEFISPRWWQQYGDKCPSPYFNILEEDQMFVQFGSNRTPSMSAKFLVREELDSLLEVYMDFFELPHHYVDQVLWYRFPIPKHHDSSD